MQQEELRQELLDFLESHRAMTVATRGGASPWAATVFYVNEQFTLYYLSSPESRHSRDITENSVVALAINGECLDWRKLKGVQLQGVAEEVLDAREIATASRLFTAKYPFVEGLWSGERSLVARLAGAAGLLGQEALKRLGSVRFYKVTATRAFFMDNTKGFGHRDEVSLT